MSNRELPSISSTSYASSTVSTADLKAPLVAYATDDVVKRALAEAKPRNEPKEAPMAQASRVVKVFIADPDENLKLADRLIYRGDEVFTDQTDQELFFDVPIRELLDAHNAKRAKTIDRKATEKFGRDVFLEAVRVRDLRMTIVTVASF